MIHARFRMALPGDVWVAEVSRSFPEATFRLLTGVPMGDRSLELGEVLAEDPEPAVEAVRSHPDVHEYELLYAGEGRAIAQYRASEQRLYEFLWDSSLPPEFPVVIEDGAMEFDLTATREQFEAFGAALDDTGFRYELLSVVQAEGDEDLLTDRQREFLEAALRRGYFAVPRDCTLAELAETLGVDKSTASETIRRGTERVVDRFLLGQD